MRHTRELFLLLLAALFIRLPRLFVIPVRDAPDEANHLWVVDFLKTHLRLPEAVEIHLAGQIGEYGSLPQFGYLPHALTSWLLNMPLGAPLGARLGSLLAGLAAIVAAYFIGREIFGKQRVLALALPTLLAVQPQFVFVGCYCNNDSTVAAIAAWIIYILVKCINHGPSFRYGLWLGLLLSWLTLCKYFGLSIVPVVITAVVLVLILHKSQRSRVLLFLCAIVIPYLVLTTWWWIRNYHQFGGGVLGTKTMYMTWAKAFHRRMDYYMPAYQILTTPRWWRMLFYSYWGAYGHMNRYLWRPVYFVYIGFVVTAAFDWLRKWRTVRDGSAVVSVERSIWFLFALALLVNMAALVWAGTGNLGGPQGRYLFTSLIPIDALLLAGLAGITVPAAGLPEHRSRQGLVLAFPAFNFLVSCGSWAYLYLLYGFQCF